ncbi:MAG: hypothetical protein U0232_09600 [Thermomicrobiales bacterium]
MRKRSRPFVLIRHFLILMIATTFALTAWINFVEPQAVGASHFRAMQLSWDKVAVGASIPGAQLAPSYPAGNQIAPANTAKFTSTFGVRRSFYGSPNVNDTITGPLINFGDGQTGGSDYTVTFVDATNDYVLAERIVYYTYAAINNGGSPYTAELNDCCRLSGSGGHVNNPDGGVRITTAVNFAVNTADLGSPVSGLAPIIDCPRVAAPGTSTCSFIVTATDPSPTGYRLNWRMATLAEMGNVVSQPSGPGGSASVAGSNGLYTWNTTDATLATCGGCNYTYYSTQVIVEKWFLNGTPGNTGDDVLVSNVAIDFFIRFNNNPTNNPPVFTSGPNDGDTLTWQPGVPNSITFTANDPNSGDVVTPSVIGLPPGASFTPTPGNPASGILNWPNPISGSYQVVLRAQDQLGLGATPRTITIVVPSLSASSLTVSGTGTYGGTGTLTATLTGPLGIPLPGMSVQLTLNGVQVCDNVAGGYPAACPTTDSSGVATLTNVSLTGLPPARPIRSARPSSGTSASSARPRAAR